LLLIVISLLIVEGEFREPSGPWSCGNVTHFVDKVFASYMLKFVHNYLNSTGQWDGSG
jgi:hypothetical protein